MRNVPDTPFKQIALGNTHACGLTRAGKAVCWGRSRKLL